MARILTVILNWRTPEMSLRSAEAALHAMSGMEGAIHLVDNASGDGSFERMQDEAKARGWERGNIPIHVLQSGWNGGFGAGNNYGIKAAWAAGARPDYVYILNSDAFPAPDALAPLLEVLAGDRRLGMAGSSLHGSDGAPHRSAFRFPSVLGELEMYARIGPISRLLSRHIVPMPLPARRTAVDWLAGASLMLRSEMLEEIGLFDETFFLYFEETELCHRAAKAGWGRMFVPESRVHHIGSVSTGMGRWSRIPRFWLDSRLHYFIKTRGRVAAFAATLATLVGGSLWQIRRKVEGAPPLDPPQFYRDLLCHHLRHGWSRKTDIAGRLPARSGRRDGIAPPLHCPEEPSP